MRKKFFFKSLSTKQTKAMLVNINGLFLVEQKKSE